jgi:hypothetical protein
MPGYRLPRIDRKIITTTRRKARWEIQWEEFLLRKRIEAQSLTRVVLQVRSEEPLHLDPSAYDLCGSLVQDFRESRNIPNDVEIALILNGRQLGDTEYFKYFSTLKLRWMDTIEVELHPKGGGSLIEIV